MNRDNSIQQLKTTLEFDICIIGGGATGLGIAVDAASRGFKTILVEKYDFAKGTSSRSTKLIHGGVRYLQQGNIKLVIEALEERGLLLKNAPHLVRNLKFIIPNYKWWEAPFYGIGLKMYDWMSGKLGLGPSQFLSLEETLEMAPTLDTEGLRGGVVYHDGQFDDARLAINLATTAAEQSATIINYCGVTGFLKSEDKVIGVTVFDSIDNKVYEIKAKIIINATGVFTDTVLKMDDPSSATIIAASQGIHLVIDKSFLPGETAIMIPQTDDGRVLFAVPWHGKIILGTTDTPVDNAMSEPIALDEEIDYILSHIGRYLSKNPGRNDVLSVFAGLRPLVKSEAKSTAALSREHLITVSNSGLITIAGGKWTTYRKMAEDVIDLVNEKLGIDMKPCITKDLKIHGWTDKVDHNDPLYYYGNDRPGIESIMRENSFMTEKIHPDLPYTNAEIVWAVRNEMCMTVEDALSRRTRALLLNAKASMEAAGHVARIIAREKNLDEDWISDQVKQFLFIAKNYLPNYF